MKRPGVVVVTYNSAATLDATLESVAHEDVIVVDNASTDESVLVARQHPRTEVLALPSNVGFGRACNIGMRRFPDRDVFLLNPDAQLIEGDIGALQAEAHEQTAAIVLPQLLNPDGTHQLSTRPFPSLLEVAGRLRSPTISGGPAPSGATTVDWGIGAAMLITRDALDGIGGFDERFFLYFEDVDLCLRAWRAGHRVVHTSSVVLLHQYQRASHAKWNLSQRAVRLHWRSFLQYVGKHPRVALRLSSSSVFGAG